MSYPLLAELQSASSALSADPTDGAAQARARAALVQAREAWAGLDRELRATLGGPARELRELLDSGVRPLEQTPEQLLERAGLARFRTGQREAVQAALDGRDSLVVMPTGAGKSLCYQLPALAPVGLVVVVSPLIALMTDQLGGAQLLGVRALMLSSGMAEGEYPRALATLREGHVQLLLVSPERFASAAFRAALATQRVGLFVVDEAHCVSEWGHDFRPDYLRLEQAITALGRPPVMAATATATPRVSREVIARLGLRDPVIVRSGFDRPNLSFDVLSFEGKGAMTRKRAALLQRLRQADGLPAIVYCGTRKQTDELAAALTADGLRTVAYHAGLGAGTRQASQRAFMSGDADVIVATNAFGMGVDKANVRTVAHWAIPTSLEGYYQEAGRAGRDGRPAHALLLASRVDLGRLIKFNTDRRTSVEDVRGYVEALARQGPDGGVLECDPPADAQRMLLAVAERAGAVRILPASAGRLRIELCGPLDGGAAGRALQVARDRGWEAYRAIERFVATPSCRRAQLLAHFADPEPGAPSGRCCDVCDPEPGLASSAEGGAALARAARVVGAGRGAAQAVAGVAPSEEQLDPAQTEAFERLRTWRRERAADKPAYTVASDAVLRELVRRRPANRSQLLAVKGIGPSFWSKYGQDLLDELARSRAAPVHT
jgi:RecQ family ATP-dependent DNA helicase